MKNNKLVKIIFIFVIALKSLSPIARKIGLSLAPEVPTIKRVGSNAPIEKVEGEDLQKVPVYSVAGAGPGVMLDSKIGRAHV